MAIGGFWRSELWGIEQLSLNHTLILIDRLQAKFSKIHSAILKPMN